MQSRSGVIATPSLPAPILRRGVGRLGVGRVMAGAPITVAVGLLLVFPLASFLLLAWWPGLFGEGSGGFTLHAFGEALSGYAVQALFDSLVTGVACGVLAVAAGLFLSWLTQRTTFAARRAIDALVWLLLLAPSYLLAIGWQMLLQRGGLLWHSGIDIGWLRDVFFGPVGVIVVLATKLFPFAYLAIAPSWRGIGGELEDAARVHGLGTRQRAMLISRLLLPAIMAGFAVVFAEAIGDFGVAATLGATANFPLATYAIYQALYANPLNFPLAAATSWFLISLTGVAVLLQVRVNARADRYAVLSGRNRSVRRVRLEGRSRAVAWTAVALLAVVSLGIPILGTIATSFTKVLGNGLGAANLTFANYDKVLHARSMIGPFLYSGGLAIAAGTVAVALSLVLAGFLGKKGGLARAVDLLMLGTMAMPGLVLAAGYIFAYNQSFAPLYGTSFLLGMAYVGGAVPSISRILMGPVTQVNRNLHEAARVHSIGPLARLRHVTLPLLVLPLLYAWLVAASGIMFELPASELLYPPGDQPLAVALIWHVQNFDFGLSTALEVSAVLVVVAAVLLARALVMRLAPRGWRQAEAPSPGV